MVKVEVTGGICGFSTMIQARKEEKYKASFQLETQCPNWQKVNDILGGQPINMMAELFKNKETGKVDSKVLSVSLGIIPHISCPVISGVLKALEVSVDLALPRDAAIRFVE